MDKQDPTRDSTRALDLVEYQDDAVVSRTIVKKSAGSITVFAFDEGQELSEHTVPYDALVQVLEGQVEIRVSGQPRTVRAGELTIMPANEPHALKALSRFKMILTMVRSE